MNKKFDCVAFQRKRRAELSEKYNEDHDSFVKELREKYPLPKALEKKPK